MYMYDFSSYYSIYFSYKRSNIIPGTATNGVGMDRKHIIFELSHMEEL
jgi:hypothetical protein